MALIYILGYMGSGKSTVGRVVAKNLNYDFIDLDNYIEKTQSDTIYNIFTVKGEQFFRELEHDSLLTLVKKTNTVVSCGGGTPHYFDNIDVMNKSGYTFYLKANEDFLFQHLLHKTSNRPLLKNKNETELKNFIKKQLRERGESYQKAKFIVDINNLSVADVALTVYTTIKNML